MKKVLRFTWSGVPLPYLERRGSATPLQRTILRTNLNQIDIFHILNI